MSCNVSDVLAPAAGAGFVTATDCLTKLTRLALFVELISS